VSYSNAINATNSGIQTVNQHDRNNTSQAEHDAETSPRSKSDAKAEAKQAQQLRTRLHELVDQHESIQLEMDEIQGELEALGDDSAAEMAPGGGPVGRGESDLHATLHAELAQAREQHQRVLADFRNFQKRANENERRARAAGAADVLETIVPVLDTFDMALRMDPDKTPASAVLQGVEMIKGEMLRVLGGIGFGQIAPAPGEEFNPNRHEAVSKVEAGEHEPGAVVELSQAGYALGDRVLRPAKVVVATAADEPGAGDETDEHAATSGDAAGVETGATTDSESDHDADRTDRAAEG
jgi:molecular chaperone GrpE